jgi:transposase
MNGIDQRTMGCRGNDSSAGQSAGRRARTALARPAHRVQRHLVDFADGRAVEGFAAAIRFIPDGPPAIPTVGAFGRDRESVAGAGRTPAAGRGIGLEGMFRGRDVCSGQKRGRLVGKTKRGKGTKIMGIADGHGLPLALRTESASPAEVKLVEATLAERFVPDVPERLVGDKAYDSDRLDERLMQHYGTELIAPNKVNRRIPTQDGRPLRRYVRRWKIERLFAWLFNFRRLVVRYEYHAQNFQGFLHLAAAIILLRYL